MSDPAHVLVVANRTAATRGLLDAVRERARSGPSRFHLVVPANPHGLHRVVDPQDHGRDEAAEVLAAALPQLSKAAGSEVTGAIGDAEPLMAIEDAVNLGDFDELIISTLPRHISRWLHLDLIHRAKRLGLPITHVEATAAGDHARDPVGPSASAA